MATDNQKITELNTTTSAADTDLIPVVVDPASAAQIKKITVANLLNRASGVLIVPTAAAPAQTTEGSVVWDSDDDKLTVGDGSSRKTLMNENLLTTRGDIPVRNATVPARLAVGANGTFLKSDGTDPAWSAIAGKLFLSAAGMWVPTTSGATAAAKVEYATNDPNLYHIDFADAATSYAECSVVMPTDWDALTVTAQFYWTNANAVSTVCRWQLEARAYGDGDAIDAAQGTPQAVDDAMGGTANQLRISAATSALTVAGTPAGGELVQFRVARLGGHANDTLTTDARLIGVLITYAKT